MQQFGIGDDLQRPLSLGHEKQIVLLLSMRAAHQLCNLHEEESCHANTQKHRKRNERLF